MNDLFTTFDFDTPIDRLNTYSLKWDKYKDRDIIPLWLADMDFRSPPAVIDALIKRVNHGIFGYTLPPDELVDIIIAMLKKRYRWEVMRNWIVWLPGLVAGLNLSCRAVGEKGDDVISFIPVYPPFLFAPGHSRRNIKTVKLINDGVHWIMDFDRLEKTLSGRTRLILFCNPHNPVGRVFTREELKNLAEICEKHNIIICSDEIHCDLILAQDKAHVPIAAIDPEIARRTITLMSPSKTFNLPGLSCSFAIIPGRALRQNFKNNMTGIVSHVNIMGYIASLAAYRDGWEWHASLIQYLRSNRALVATSVNQMPGFSMTHVEATYLAWIDTRESGIKDPAVYFENAGVGLSDGSDFGGPGFLRLNFACSRQTLQTGLERMITAATRKK